MQKQEELLRRISNIEKLLEQRKTKPLNLVEAAKYLSISQSHLYKLTSQRKLPAHKPNGKYLYFYKDELDEWVRSSSKDKVQRQKVDGGECETANVRREAEIGGNGDGVSDDASTSPATADKLSTGDEDEEPP